MEGSDGPTFSDAPSRAGGVPALRPPADSAGLLAKEADGDLGDLLESLCCGVVLIAMASRTYGAPPFPVRRTQAWRMHRHGPLSSYSHVKD
jgi:hypothetical protein